MTQMTMKPKETMDAVRQDKKKPSDERVPPTVPTIVNKNKIEKMCQRIDDVQGRVLYPVGIHSVRGSGARVERP